MSTVLAGREQFLRAQEDAKKAIDRARAGYGKSIQIARQQDGATQDEIAKALGLTREQVRRYERFYETWRQTHGEP